MLIGAFSRSSPKLFAVASLLAAHVNAQNASDAAPRDNGAAAADDAVVMPEPIVTWVTYPEGWNEAATVVLELTITPEGGVRDARVLEGREPFSEVAQTAALTWRFTPATRNGRPIPARIRFSLLFTPPEPEPALPGSPPLSVPSGDNRGDDWGEQERPSQAKPLEFVVAGERRPAGAVSVTREEARALPGTFGDPLRAIEAQPGVVPIVSGLPAFFIRGAPPANVGFFVDGVDLPLLYHAFLGPSVVHPALIGSIEFYPGAAPVQYGRFAGPVVAVRTQPFEGRFTGEGALRAIDVGGFVEAPFGSCDDSPEEQCARSGARIAGRYSYTGLILSALSDAKLDYWDYLAQVEYAIGPDDTLGVLAFGGYDYFRAPQQSENSGGELSFHRVDLRWDRRMGERTDMRLAVTAGYDRAAGPTDDSSIVTDQSLRARLSVVHQASSDATLHAGLDARGDRYGLETNPRYFSYPDYSTLFPERDDVVVGGYLAAELIVARGIHLAPGVRADVYRSQGRTAIGVDPRVAAEFYVSRRVRLDHSLGISHQRPNFAAQVPGAQVADLKGGLQWALQWSSGIRVELPWELTAAASVFRSAYFDALDPIGGARDFTIDRSVLDRRSTVSAAGLELKLSRALTKRLGGFLSYTLSRSEQSTGRLESLSGFDRPHVLQGAIGYELGNGIRLGARAVVYSGIPELNLQDTPNFSGERRGTPYFRVDVRAEKRWRLGTRGYWGLTAEVLNATSTREVVRLDCGELCRERVAGPIVLPSVGLEAGF